MKNDEFLNALDTINPRDRKGGFSRKGDCAGTDLRWREIICGEQWKKRGIGISERLRQEPKAPYCREARRWPAAAQIADWPGAPCARNKLREKRAGGQVVVGEREELVAGPSTCSDHSLPLLHRNVTVDLRVWR